MIIEDKYKKVENPMVSIFCNAYNQEDYISRCLDGFLSQKTSFPYEILVTDDASSDSTPLIIRRYAEKRPDLFTAILHEDNQYSKGVDHNRTYLYPRARGNYIALCEGDDYWTDPQKLQRQFDAMETHESATWCVHSSTFVEADTEKPLRVLRPFDSDCILDFRQTGEQIQLAATASFFIRKTAYKHYLDSAPSKVTCHGDFKMSRFFALTGDTLYLEKPMSAYRVLAKSSINSTIAHDTNWRGSLARDTHDRIQYLRKLDEWSNGAHSEDIAEEIDTVEYLGAIDLKDYKQLKTRWPDRFAQESLSRRAKTKLLGNNPKLYDALRKFKFQHFPYLGMKE